MLYLNEKIKNSDTPIKITKDSVYDELNLLFSRKIADHLNINFEKEVKSQKLFISYAILRHFEEKLKGEFSIDLDLHDLSEKDFKMFINVSRDDLCYPNDLYFNFLCNKKQSQILRQNSRVFDFVSKKYNIQH